MFLLIGFLIFLLSINPRLATIPIALLFLISLFKWSKNYRSYIKNISSAELLVFAFYILHIIGTFYSIDKESAFFDLEVKLSLLIFPFIFISIPALSNSDKRIVYKGLKYGLIIGIIGGLIGSLSLYFESGQIAHLFSSYFSKPIPPNYYGIYILTGILLVLKMINESKRGYLKSDILFLIILFVGLVLSASRAAFLALIILICMYLVYQFFFKKDYKTGLLAFLLITVFSILIIKAPIIPFERFKAIYSELKEDNNPKTRKSSSIRYQIWNASIDAINSNLIFGVGTGDIKPSLKKSYKKLGIETASKKNLNTHNQFLQSWLALGALGILTLVLISINGLWVSYINSDIFSAGIIISWVIFMLTESCLERQYGVIIFTVIYLVLMKRSKYAI